MKSPLGCLQEKLCSLSKTKIGGGRFLASRNLPRAFCLAEAFHQSDHSMTF